MKRSFHYLFVLTLLALLAIWVFIPENDPARNPVADNLLLPEISEQINAVNRVEIVAPGNQTVATLVKATQGWQLEQMGGYRADWATLQTLLANLAQARVIEHKTDKPEYYARLGVEDITAEDAGGILVKLSIGDQTTGILVGHEGPGSQGQYVRLQHSSASALLDRKLDIATEQLDWADSTIVDISASEVAEVEIIHPAGQSVFVTKISADQTDFDLVGLRQGREVKNSWSVNSLGSVFSMLNMQSVRAVGSIDWSAAVKLRLLVFSGVEIIADVMELEGEYLLRLHATYPAADVLNNQPEENQDSIAQQDIEKQAVDDIKKTVEDINQRVVGWVYGIAKPKYDAMVKLPEDLLKPLEQS